MNKKITIITSIIIVLCVLCLIFFITFVPKKESILQHTSVQTFSDDSYKIYFAKKIITASNGNDRVLEIYSIKSNGADLMFERKEKEEKIWQQKISTTYWIGESMGNYFGEIFSSDGTKKISVTSAFGGMFNPFSVPRFYLEQNSIKELLVQDFFSELIWLPDNRRIVFADGERIGIIDIETKNIAYIAEGVGYIWVEESD